MITVYNLEQSNEWRKIVTSFNKYDVYYLPGYVRAFQIHGDGEPLLVYWTEEKDGSGSRGINVLMKRDIANTELFSGIIEPGHYYDVTTPYGYGGWLIEGDNIDELFVEYNQWCKQNCIVDEFVRLHPMLENQVGCEKSYEVVPLGETVAIDLISPEDIWINFSGKNRNHIRKAIKSGVKIYSGRFPEAYKTFESIYNGTMEKDNADSYYYFEDGFYDSVLNDLAENAQVFWAELGSKVIAASIMLSTNGYMNYHLSGSLQEYSSLAASNLLLYEASLWGCANGCRTLYLGGGVGSEEDSLLKFKKSFYKGDTHRFYIGKKIFDNDTYDKLCEIRGIDSESDGFFPRYRAD